MIEEYWDIVDRNGNDTGEILSKTETIEKGLYHKGVDLWILNKNNEMLIQKRAKCKRLYPNLWAMTGGAVMAGETAEQAICRECIEELSIEIDISKLQFLERHNTEDIWIETFIIKQDIDISTILMQEEEVSEFKYVSINDLNEIVEKNEFIPYRWEFVKDKIEAYIKSDKEIDR